MFTSQVHAAPRIIADAPGIDAYAARGVELSRDAASLVAGALRRDAYDLRTRPVEANLRAADMQDKLAHAILSALAQ